jgi:hypothetical protein
MNTGAGTPAGAANWGLPSQVVIDGVTRTVTPAIVTLATNAAGAMYGLWADDGVDDVVAIDKATGTVTRLGEFGAAVDANGLAFDNAGTLYLVNGHRTVPTSGGAYYTVDLGTGLGTAVGDIGRTAHHGVFDPATNLYYGIDGLGGATDLRNLLVADLESAACRGLTSDPCITSTIPTVNNLHTLAFVDVSEPGSLLVLGIGAVGVFLARRRKRQ